MIQAAHGLFGATVAAASPPFGLIDPEWAIPLNTLLWVVLAYMNRRTKQSADAASEKAGNALQVVADTRRVVKESHNATVGVIEDCLQKKYTDNPDETGRFREVEDTQK